MTNLVNKLLGEFVQPRIVSLAQSITEKWDDSTIVELHKYCEYYLEGKTGVPSLESAIPVFSRAVEAQTTITEPQPSEDCEPRKPRRKGYKKVTAEERLSQNQKLVATLVARGNDGVKMIRIDPEDVGTDIAGLLKCVAQFNACKWRQDNCPDARLYYKPSLTHVDARMVRTDI